MGSIENKLTFKLNTGASIPAVGLGTWQSAPGEASRAVKHAISVGYRHIDTAYFYGNEEEIGTALREVVATGIVARKELFITTKLWCTYHTRVEQNLDQSLRSLGLEYIDLYLMHWPIAMNPDGNHDTRPMKPDGSRDLDLNRSHVETYLEMEKLLSTGKVKAIGVANYSAGYLKELLAKSSVVPAVNQVELHPQLPQEDLLDLCRRHGIHNTAYSPLGSTGAPLTSHPQVLSIADKRGVSAGVILLSYHVARGCSVLPKSVTLSRIEQNLYVITLDKKEMSELDRISKTSAKRYLCPDFASSFGWSKIN